MKPNPKSDATVIQPPAAPPGGSPVADELKAIDRAPLEQLLAIRKEQARIADFRHRADDLKSQAKDAVRARVLADYATRAAALETQAAPLAAQVGAEYRKVRQLLDRVSQARDAAALEKEELEFRHAVGELTDAALTDHMTAPVAMLERCAVDLAAVQKHEAEFVEALGAQVTEAAAPPAPVPPVAAGAPTAPPLAASVPMPKPATVPVPPVEAAPVRASSTTILSPEALAFAMPDLAHLTPPPMPRKPAEPVPAVPAKAPPPAVATQPETGGDETRILPRYERTGAAQGEATPRPAPVDPNSEAQTFMLPAGALIVTPLDGSPVEHRLAALNHLGRSEDNQIQIPTPGVSRRHALVVATSSGFMVKDLQSQNGTFVNGSKITEHTLVDGDRISIGDTHLVYRSPWPK